VSDFKQRALGVDLQYAHHHLEVYAEFIFNRFDVPNITESLGAKGYYIEVKQTLTPRIFAAVRWNQIYFGRLQYEPASGEHPRFDDNVDSLEVGMGYRFTEKLLSKFSYQYNRTLSDMVPRENVFAAQLVYSLDIRSLLRIR
jgi:hypothetical protein